MAKNRLLKKPGTVSEYTPELVQELIKCSTDAIYFIQTYCKIVHPTKGLIPFTLYDFQKDIISAYVSNRYNILCSARQSGKSQISCVYLLHYAMFHPNSTILIVSNKSSGSKEMVHRITTAYEHLPDWLRPAINPGDWNKLSISFDNGSKIIAEATTEQSGRGLSVSLLFWDETGWANATKNQTSESLDRVLWTSLSPVLAQGGSAILASTPNGDDNLFAELWRNAYIHKNNGFNAVFVPWNVVPGRDEKFKQEEIAKIGLQKWLQEYECLKFDTIVEIVDEHSNEQSIQVIELYDKTPNTKYKIKTPNGWESFDGVKYNGNKQCYKLVFEDNSFISVTGKHRFFDLNNREIFVYQLSIGDTIKGESNKTIISITDDGIHPVYDILNTESHTFYSNGVVSHNCEFISSDPLLVNSTFLVDYKTPEQPAPDAFRIVWFEKIRPGSTYLLGIDPSTGSGSDYSVIEIYSFPKLEQIAEFRCNDTSTPNLYMTLNHILKTMQKQGAENCYWSFENNAIGEGLIAMYQSDESPVEFGDLISDPGKARLGFTTGKNKMRLCVDFKEMFESGRIKVKSEIMISELKNFVRKSGSYAARAGSADDVVMAHMIILRLLHEIVQYEDNAYNIIHEPVGVEIEEEYEEPLAMLGPGSDYYLDYAYQNILGY
jgi:hypothetical protein